MPMKKAPKKKTTAKKTAGKKTGAPAKKKAVVKKTAVKKAAAKAPAKKKAAAKKKAVKKAPATKPSAKKKASVPKKAVEKASVTAPVKKKTVKKSSAAKPSARHTLRKTVSEEPTRSTSAAQKASASQKLSKKDIEKFKKMLLAEREHLIASINNIEETSRTESGHDNGADLASFAEIGTDSFNIETALNIASGESRRLRDVIDALDRIERGTYGICEGSGQPIPKKRLEAFPSARFCIEYQQELEQQSAMNNFR